MGDFSVWGFDFFTDSSSSFSHFLLPPSLDFNLGTFLQDPPPPLLSSSSSLSCFKSSNETWANMSETEALENEIQQLKTNLTKREEELQLAGTIGKELLQQNEASNEAIHVLENERSSYLNEIDDLKMELEVMREKMGTFASMGLEQAMKEMKDENGRKERQIQAEKEKYRELMEEHRELQVKEEVLRAQLSEAESFTAALENTSGSLKETNEKLRKNEELVEKMERENKRLKEEMDEMKSQKVKEDGERKILMKEMREHVNAGKVLSQQKATLEAENCDLKSQLGQSESGHKGELARKVEELKAVKGELERVQGESSHFRGQYNTLHQQYLYEAKERLILVKEKEEMKTFLDEAHRKVKRLQAANEENEAASSLEREFADFERENAEKAEKASQAAAENTNEEYFYLTVAAVKANLASKNQKRLECLQQQVDIRALFDECLDEGVVFHEWHEWLSKELTRRLLPPLAPDVPQRQHGQGGRGNPPKREDNNSIFHNFSRALFGEEGKPETG